jgi:hypothetical protein
MHLPSLKRIVIRFATWKTVFDFQQDCTKHDILALKANFTAFSFLFIWYGSRGHVTLDSSTSFLSNICIFLIVLLPICILLRLAQHYKGKSAVYPGMVSQSMFVFW